MRMMITRELWYKRPDIIFNIINAGKNRELGFLDKENKVPVRNIYANYSKILTGGKDSKGCLIKGYFQAYQFFKRKYNVYYGLARVKDIRIFSFSPLKRKEQSMMWNKEFMRHVTSLDFGLDFDAPSFNEWRKAYTACKLIKEDLDMFGVPYTLKFSGGRGFHIVIPFEALPSNLLLVDDRDDLRSVSVFVKNVAEIMSAYYGEIMQEYAEEFGLKIPRLKCLDLAVFDYRRLWKADYSWVCETDLIALPLSDEQFNNFSVDIVRPENVLKMGVYNRGDLMREGGRKEFAKYLLEVLGLDIDYHKI